MEPSANGAFDARWSGQAAENFADAACGPGSAGSIYLGGLVPDGSEASSPHLASRLAVEKLLIDAHPSPVAFRASIVIGAARARSASSST
jgi:hypothetical protein